MSDSCGTAVCSNPVHQMHNHLFMYVCSSVYDFDGIDLCERACVCMSLCMGSHLCLLVIRLAVCVFVFKCFSMCSLCVCSCECVWLSVTLFDCLSLCLSVMKFSSTLYVCLSLCECVCLSFCDCVCLCVCVCGCVCVFVCVHVLHAV